MRDTIKAPLHAPAARFACAGDVGRERKTRVRQAFAQRERRHAVLIGQQTKPVRLQQLLDELHNRLDVPQLVDQIRREQDRHLQLRRRRSPVHLQGREILKAIQPGIAGGEPECRGVVVAEDDAQPFRERRDARQAQTAADFQCLEPRGPGLADDRLGEHARRRPKVRPVR